tara:strand:+ start:77 stop:775 length:699 start_codon:yes stop_codon:yes gene_type:complete
VESNDQNIRTIDEIEKLADEFNLTYFSANNENSITLPVPVEDIAEHYLGYQIDFVNEGLFSDPEILGGIDFDENKIYVNASVEDHDGRYAFTIAHEIGHHVLHRDAYLKENLEGKKEILCRDARNKPRIELEADRFAAALLMPAQSVRDILSQVNSSQKVKTIGQARGLASKIIKEGELNNVSNTAMVNRLIDLRVISDYIGYQKGINSQHSKLSVFSYLTYRLRKLIKLSR